MIAARARVEQRNAQGWGDINELLNWLNPEDPIRGVEKRVSLARYVHYRQNNELQGYFALPCLRCDDDNHFIGFRYLLRDPWRFGWDRERYALVNSTPRFFEDHLLPSIFSVAELPNV